MTKPIELKPCPFCGGQAETERWHSVWIVCTKCGAESKICLEVKAAAKLWNKRVKHD